ncbi:MAG: glycoside hydrolase family 57 protein [Terriglobales bacterium]
MAVIRLVFLWHMHQPFYKDLVSGEYRLPWVRLHALKDYYGMVKLLDEFPTVHQTFNLVPSLVLQIQEYVAGQARDPFLAVASKAPAELSPTEKGFCLHYLFQANPTHLIGRYPRYRQLFDQFRAHGASPEKAAVSFSARDFADLQVLSQIAWFDEFFLDDPEVAGLIRKGQDFNADDQKLVLAKQREFLGRVLPAYREAAQKGSVELSTSPFYHPILPLLCDTNNGQVSSPGLLLPQERFRHPEDALEQLQRGIAMHEQVFGVRPRGAWPSEGSISDEVMTLGHQAGIEWMASDEEVLGRTQGRRFAHDGTRLLEDGAERLYKIYRYEKDGVRMHLLFRDHILSDLIGFVYAGMPPQAAAQEFLYRIKESAAPVVNSGRDAVVSIILDGENAWEYYPASGREFLRRVYGGIAADPAFEAVTITEAISRQRDFGSLSSLAPGSWIHANFNVWIGAPEDNKAWDYLSAARDAYSRRAPSLPEEKRKLAWEEILISEGSDWNWWYGPQHHSANDRDFDELYRKHLSNVYQLLDATPPEYLGQPIGRIDERPQFSPQTAYIRPRIDGDTIGYFEWLGAASYTADRRGSSMHGKQFVLDAVYAGIDDANLYARVDFAGGVPRGRLDVVVKLESLAAATGKPQRQLRAEVALSNRTIVNWKIGREEDADSPHDGRSSSGFFEPRFAKLLEFQIPLAELGASAGSKVRMRFSVWRDRLPVDALPAEGWLELDVVSEDELAARA